MDEFKQSIQIKFSTCSQTNEQIFDVYVKTLTDAVNAARGDKEALKKLNNLGKELKWLTGSLIEEIENGK